MKRKKLFSLVLALILALCLPLSACSSSSTNSVEEASHGVVAVYSSITLSNGSDASCLGSAFGVGVNGEDATYFITNRHVVTAENDNGSLTQAQHVYIMLGQNAYTQTLYFVVTPEGTLGIIGYNIELNSNKIVECDVVAYSEDYDIAILKPLTTIEGRVALDLADSAEDCSVADTVYALGYPGISDDLSTANSEFSGNYYDYEYEGTVYSLPIYTYNQATNADISDVTVTRGTVSRFTSLVSENNVKVIQHDATIHGGNSGGPLVDASGRVVGINTYEATDTESINYAITVDYIRSFCEESGIEVDVSKFPIVPVIIGVVVVLLIVAAVVILLITRGKKKPKTSTNPVPQPVPGPQFDAMHTSPIQQETQPLVNDSGFRIQGTTGQFVGKRFAISGTVKIGRDSTQCQIVYPAATQGISRVHCELFVSAGKLYLRDLNSAYGTFLQNGQRLASNQAVELLPGQQFYLASPQESFQISRRGGV